MALICGGRDFNNSKALMEALDQLHADAPITCVIEGGAAGADRMARTWAIATGVPYTTYPAQWAQYGRAAGYKRNQQMLDAGKPTVVIAFPGGPGTANMIKLATQAGVPVIQVTCDKQAGPTNGLP